MQGLITAYFDGLNGVSGLMSYSGDRAEGEDPFAEEPCRIGGPEIPGAVEEEINSKVDPITLRLLEIYSACAKERSTVSKFVRDSLMANLIVKYGAQCHKLARWFRISKNYAKHVIKQHLNKKFSDVMPLDEFRAKLTRMKKIQEVVNKRVDSKRGIVTVNAVTKILKDDQEIELSYNQARKIFSTSLKLKWKRIRGNDSYVKTEVNVMLRKEFALQVIEVIRRGSIILNYDESAILSTSNRNFSWDRRGSTCQRAVGKKISGLSILLAVSSTGGLHFQFLDGNNNKGSVAAYFISLALSLDQSSPGWRSTQVLLLDNCASHETALVRSVMRSVGFTVMFGAPASYSLMPVERVFALMKSPDFDAEPDPAPPISASKRIRRLTNKQTMQLKIAAHLRGLSRSCI